MSILNKVKLYINKHNLITPEDKILVACSGGCDSFALTHILAIIQEELNFRLYVANVNHMLRQESYEEALVVEEFCKKLNIPYYHKAIDIKAFMNSNRKSLQDAARFKRYEYFNELKVKLNIDKIATGHHIDDQIETVLLNILRGTGSSGLVGIKPQSNNIIRPILSLTRSETEEYCQNNNITWCEDASNFKTDYLRNKVRLELIPLLAENYNPNIKENIYKTSEIIATENNLIDELTTKHLKDLVIEHDNYTALKLNDFLNIHLALKRSIIRKIIEQNLGTLKGITFNYVESLINIALNSQVGSVFLISNLINVEKTYEELLFYKNTKNISQKVSKDTMDFTFKELIVPGITICPELSLEIHTSLFSIDNKPSCTSNLETLFDLDTLKLPLIIRTRQTGDKFKPLNMTGSKKLKKFFIDEKIPNKTRNNLPLICDKDDIIWIAGHRKSDKGKLSSKSNNIIKIKINPIN